MAGPLPGPLPGPSPGHGGPAATPWSARCPAVVATPCSARPPYPDRVIWQTVLDVIDAVESWVAGRSYWIQVLLLLGVLGPLCYLVAGIIDRVVEAALAWHGRRDPIAGSRGSRPPAALEPTDGGRIASPAAAPTAGQ